MAYDPLHGIELPDIRIRMVLLIELLDMAKRQSGSPWVDILELYLANERLKDQAFRSK